MGLADHAERELREAGLFDKDSEYGGMLGESVLELVKKFAEQGHSGFSAHQTIRLFTRLASYSVLVPLKNPYETHEYIEVSADVPPLLQSTRKSTLFSDDGKRWYDIDVKVPWYRRIFGQKRSYVSFPAPKVSQGLGCLHSAPTRGCWACERDFPELVKPVPAVAEPALKEGWLERQGENSKLTMEKLAEVFPAETAEYTCPRCGSNVSTHICMGEPVAGETNVTCQHCQTAFYSANTQLAKCPKCKRTLALFPAPSVAVPEGEASDRIFVEVCDLVTYCKKKNKPAGYLAAEVTRLIRNHISATPPTNPVSTAAQTFSFEDTPEFWKALARRFVRNCHKKKHEPFWATVSAASGHGSTYSADICRYFGIDPDTGAAHVLAEKGK